MRIRTPRRTHWEDAEPARREEEAEPPRKQPRMTCGQEIPKPRDRAPRHTPRPARRPPGEEEDEYLDSDDAADAPPPRTRRRTTTPRPRTSYTSKYYGESAARKKSRGRGVDATLPHFFLNKSSKKFKAHAWRADLARRVAATPRPRRGTFRGDAAAATRGVSRRRRGLETRRGVATRIYEETGLTGASPQVLQGHWRPTEDHRILC